MSMFKIIEIYECDNCGIKETWDENWSAKFVCHEAWDEVLTVCCEQCAKELEERVEKGK